MALATDPCSLDCPSLPNLAVALLKMRAICFAASTMSTGPAIHRHDLHEQEMPLMLMTAEDVDRWLNGSSIEDTVAMQRPRLR